MIIPEHAHYKGLVVANALGLVCIVVDRYYQSLVSVLRHRQELRCARPCRGQQDPKCAKSPQQRDDPQMAVMISGSE